MTQIIDGESSLEKALIKHFPQDSQTVLYSGRCCIGTLLVDPNSFEFAAVLRTEDKNSFKTTNRVYLQRKSKFNKNIDKKDFQLGV